MLGQRPVDPQLKRAPAVSTQKDKLRISAQKYLQKGQYDKALREYEHLLQEDPNDFPALLKVGDLQYKMNQPEAAIKTYFGIAAQYAAGGFWLKAIAVYKQILSIEPHHIEASKNLAETYVRLGLVSDAQNQYRTLCYFFEAKGQWAECIDAAEHLLKLDENQVINRAKLAEMQARGGKNAEALQNFRLAADALQQSGYHEEWAKVAERIVQLDTHDLDKLQQLAQHYLNIQQPQRAFAHLQIGFKLAEDNEMTLQLLADSFQALKQDDKALAALHELALQQHKQGNKQHWVKTLESIVALDPQDTSAKEILAQIRKKKTLRPALPKIEEATVISPTLDAAPDLIDDADIIDVGQENKQVAPLNVQAAITEANTYARYGLRSKAKEKFLEIIRTHPENRDARSAYKNLLETLGDTSGAVDCLYAMAEHAMTHGQPALARQDLDALLKLQPQHAQAQILLQSCADTNHTSPLVAGDELEIEIELDPSLAPVAESIDAPSSIQAAQDVVVDINASEIENTSDETQVQPPALAPAATVANPPQASSQTPFFAPTVASPGFEPLPELPPTQSGDFGALMTQLDIVAPKKAGIEHQAIPSDSSFILEESNPFADIPSRIIHHQSTRLLENVPITPPAAATTVTANKVTNWLDPEANVNEVFDNIFNELATQDSPAMLRQDQHDTATHFDLGIAYKEMGMLTNAIQEFSQTVENSQYQVNAYTMLGLCHLQQEQIPQALECFQKGLASVHLVAQEAIALRYEIGIAYESMGQHATALKFFEKAHSMDPGFRDVQVRMEQVQQANAHEPQVASHELDSLLSDTFVGPNKVSFF